MSDAWDVFRRATPARIGLGRRTSLSTREVLAQKLAHARAQDTVHAPWDVEALRRALATHGLRAEIVPTLAGTREQYLARPDRGRVLEPRSLAAFAQTAEGPWDVAFLVSNGLSSVAVTRHGEALVSRVCARLHGLSVAPLALAPNARVAAGDALGEALRARVVVVVIGERPGLSSTDSLGIYVTAAPRQGRTDAERECISNVCPGRGLGIDDAAGILRGRIDRALATNRTGVLGAGASPVLVAGDDDPSAGRS